MSNLPWDRRIGISLWVIGFVGGWGAIARSIYLTVLCTIHVLPLDALPWGWNGMAVCFAGLWYMGMRICGADLDPRFP